MKKTADVVKGSGTNPVEGEIAELGEECTRVLLLLQRLAKARTLGREPSDILGELSAAVLHLHAHTKGLDELIDNLASD